MIKAIIFDFDGVLVDSMGLKTEAFRNLFRGYPGELVEKFVKYHLENGGLSRFVKIRYFYEAILKEEINAQLFEKLALQFSVFIKSRLADPSFLIGDSCRFLSGNSNKYDFHIASGAEENELKFLVQKLGISNYFRSVNGSPASKELIIERIIAVYSYSLENVVMIGDSRNDLDAANFNKIKFFGYNNPDLKVDNDCSYIDNMENAVFD